MPTSNIFDPISKTLDQRVFNGTDPKPSVVSFIERIYDRAFKHEFGASYGLYTELYLTGSLTTYQYSDTSDCDISVFPNYHQLEQLTGQSDDIIRKRLIALHIEHLDGTFLPGGSHPLQFFGLPDGIEPQDRFHPGVRSGWSFSAKRWLVPPEKERVHNIETEFPEMYSRAAAIADKMTEMLDAQNYDAAKQLWQQVHKKRQLDQGGSEGGGDFTEGNIVYKYLVHEGLADRLRNEVGMQITTGYRDEDLMDKRWKERGQEDHFNAFPFIYDTQQNKLFLGNRSGEGDLVGHPSIAYTYRQQGERVPEMRDPDAVFGRVFPDDDYGDYIIAYNDKQKLLNPEQRQEILDAVWAKLPDGTSRIAAWDGDKQRLMDILLSTLDAYSTTPAHANQVMMDFLVDSLGIPKEDAVGYMGQAWFLLKQKNQHGDEAFNQLMEQQQQRLLKAQEEERQLAEQHGEKAKQVLDRFDSIWPESVSKDLDGNFGYQVQHVLENGNGWKFVYRRGVGARAWGDGEVMSLNDGIHPHTYVLYDDLDVNKIIPGLAVGWIDKPPLNEGNKPYQVVYRTFPGDKSVTPQEIQQALGLQDGEATIKNDGDYARFGAVAATDPITIKVFYNFTADKILLGTQADSYRYPNTIIVGDYDPVARSVTLHKTENQWLNANYFRRLWAFSFPKRPLDNVYFQHGLTEDQKMHLPTREPQHVQHA